MQREEFIKAKRIVIKLGTNIIRNEDGEVALSRIYSFIEDISKLVKKGKEVILVTDTYYRNAIDEQVKARGNFFEKRSQLEQLVGNDIFRQFEEVVDNRMKG